MPKIAAIATALASHCLDQKTARELTRKHYSGKERDIERLLPVFDHAGIERRRFTMPAEWMMQPHSLQEKNDTYIIQATELSAQAVENVLRAAGVGKENIDYIIYVNSTGLATPSIDARLINRLGLQRHIRRTPVWGLGCAGGVAGLSLAYHHALGHPREAVLLVATELCGLTFLPDDFSKSNLVAMALFGEGSAAALITGDEVETDGYDILGSRSTFYPDSLDVMGWNVVAAGLQVVFAQRIPAIVRDHAATDIGDFLKDNDLTLGDIQAYLLHPGGQKVLAAYEEALGLGNDALELSRAVLRDHGNISSTTVLYVLARYHEMYGFGKKGYGLISALGPGFCSESMLIKL